MFVCCRSSTCDEGFTPTGTGSNLQCLPPANYISQIPGPITPVKGKLVSNFTLPVEYFLQFQVNIRNAMSNDFLNAFAISYGMPYSESSRAPSIFTCPVRHGFVYT